MYIFFVLRTALYRLYITSYRLTDILLTLALTWQNIASTSVVSLRFRHTVVAFLTPGLIISQNF